MHSAGAVCLMLDLAPALLLALSTASSFSHPSPAPSTGNIGAASSSPPSLPSILTAAVAFLSFLRPWFSPLSRQIDPKLRFVNCNLLFGQAPSFLWATFGCELFTRTIYPVLFVALALFGRRCWHLLDPLVVCL
jgi:hypothetical protein